jgi:hypothetical protein
LLHRPPTNKTPPMMNRQEGEACAKEKRSKEQNAFIVCDCEGKIKVLRQRAWAIFFVE